MWCNQFVNGETRLTVGGKDATLIQRTAYPIDGHVEFEYHGEAMTLFVRIPDWCIDYEGEAENGYARFELRDGDKVTLELPMSIHFIEANPNVQDDSGRYAVMRGPIVYCMESIDNGKNLRDITLLDNGNIKVVTDEGIAPVIYMDAERRPDTDKLYSMRSAERVQFTARLIPYFTFANRGESDMLIWSQVR